jgi:hypothetical protein
MRRRDGQSNDKSADQDMRSGATVSRRELISGAAAVGAAMMLSTEPGAAGQVGDGKMMVGAGKRIITPNPLLPVSGGMGPTMPAHEKFGELTTRAVYLKRGDVAIAIVGIDVIGFPSVLLDRIVARVPRMKRENVMIGSTHTHSAPDCYAFPTALGGHTGDLAYIDKVCVLIAEAINEAIDTAKPAVLRIATGEAKGKIAYNYYAPDLYDRRMNVVQATGEDGKTIMTLVNYAIHPEVIGDSRGICCPDLVGPLYDRLEERAGGMAIFMNSAQGGMITADNRILDSPKDSLRAYWHDIGTWEECGRIGNLMADEAVRIVSSAPVQTSPGLFCRADMLTVPVDSPEMWFVVTGSPLKYPHSKDHTVQVKINLVNLGDSQIVTCPGEALPNIGFYVKRKMRGKQNLFFGLTNDAFGYILTKVDFHSFARYDYVSRASMGEMTGEILMNKWLDMVRTSPLPDGVKA